MQNISNKLLIISGPTATGKTALAVKLAQEFNGELISADARQIYKGMDIGTGKDHPSNVKLHLIDIINPNQSFSVAQYRQLALEKITEIQSQNKLPIIVGGSGQYIDAVINPQPTFSVKPHQLLRFFLNKFSVKNLQKIYSLLDKKNFLLLNNSDKNNPHRLIRKIEIKLFSKNSFSPPFQGGIKGGFNILHVSLTSPNSYLYSQIDKRVKNRLKTGLIDEIKNILKTYKWSDPGLNTIAYKEFNNYFSKVGVSLTETQHKWKFDEHAFARRQKTWFKKINPITFVDISQPRYSQKIINLIQKWYNPL
jgi:tRNA dimethylallyltransferase